MKYLGIDYGTKRIGVAISDDAGEFAFPKTIIQSEGAIEKISQLIQEESIAVVIIGYSIAVNGTENEIMPLVNRFKEKLENLGIEVYLEREDFSSFEAHRYQTKAGNRDDSAAAIILQRFLDKKKK